MKFFHTADWHLGKLVQGIYMTEDQRYLLEQFIHMVEEEKPDAVIIAGDLYDRSIPTTEAIDLLDDILKRIVIDLDTPVLAVAGNHDGPGRLQFGSKMMKGAGFHIVGDLNHSFEPVILEDKYGPVHFHLVPYAEPGKVKQLLELEEVKTHHEAVAAIISKLEVNLDPRARHVFVGHLFVTPTGEKKENTSDSERPLSIGGAEHVSAQLFEKFHYTALGHLHQAHHVGHEKIRYAGSPLKYSISEEHHKKGFYIVEMNENGDISYQKRELIAKRDMRRIEGFIEDIEKAEVNEDYLFVSLLNDTPVISAMERIRSVYPNALHVERKVLNKLLSTSSEEMDSIDRTKLDEVALFDAFYKEVKGEVPSEETKQLFEEVLQEVWTQEGERE